MPAEYYRFLTEIRMDKDYNGIQTVDPKNPDKNEPPHPCYLPHKARRRAVAALVAEDGIIGGGAAAARIEAT